MTPELVALSKALTPFVTKKVAQGRSEQLRFVHYTSAEVGLRILRGQKISLRNALAMNDYSEIQHGQYCLEKSLDSGTGASIARATLEKIHPGSWDKAAQLYFSMKGSYEGECYAFCMSEHGSGAIDEDRYGRLSMWRAYGGDTNVALVLNNTPFLTESSAITAFTSPVFYGDPTDFDAQFLDLSDSIRANSSQIKAAGAQNTERVLGAASLFATLSTKHPGFSEEREWRVVYMPRLFPSSRVRSEIVTWAGVPQRVYHVEMKNFPDEGFVGAELAEVLSEVIVGPSNSPEIVRSAYVEALQELAVPNPNSKVRISGIPLRR